MENVLSNQSQSQYITKINENELDPLTTIAFSSAGRDLKPNDFSNKKFIFGGFAHGEYKTIDKNTIDYVKLAPVSLDLWTSIAIFLNKYIEFHDYKL